MQQADERKRGALRRAEVLKFLQLVMLRVHLYHFFQNISVFISTNLILLPLSAATTPAATLSSCRRWRMSTLPPLRSLVELVVEASERV